MAYIRCSEEVHHAVKKEAAERKVSMQDLAGEAWESYLKQKNGNGKLVTMAASAKETHGPHIADDELHYVEALLDLLRGEDQFRPVAVSLLEAHKGKPPVRHRSKKEQA